MAGCVKQDTSSIPKQSNNNFTQRSNYGNYSEQQKKLVKFLNNKMLTNQGIYTNYSQQSYMASEARGHELLSESSGLWLQYLAYTHQYKKFRSFYKKTKQTFDQGDQFSYRYTPSKNEKFNVNATLDDLRIIKALQMYADLTKTKAYSKEAATRFSKLQKNTMSEGKIASFYDVKSHKASADGSLAYYDLATLKYFESTSAKNKKMYRDQLSVVQSGFLGDAFPLYAPSYNWQADSYVHGDLNTSEAMETILHLSEVGKVKQVTLNWLKRQVDENTLYNTYSINGSVISKSHSAGSYALAAEIFAVNKNKKMYHKAMKLVWKYQIQDKSSPMYGAIGIERKNEAYSYNNLMALVAAQY
ncbi:hypothetical protein [Companilactobacillus zhachilii]|uniref:hypothetical protein n=1 Tax=Companilactobacillus zhachilii TaxID=2304606 RepID=UPI0040346584